MHADAFLREASEIAASLDRIVIENMARELDQLRSRGGRLFLVGLGGSAANCSHAAADFRRLCEIQALTPTDNVAEFSARVNDDGYANAFSLWLVSHGADGDDVLLVLSVGGGTEMVSQPITEAVRWAHAIGMSVLGVVGPEGGVTAQLADLLLKVPSSGKRITPHAEAFQAVVWHCLVSHPLLQRNATKW